MSASKTTSRLKVIVIHGWGGSYADALQTVDALLDFPVEWKNGVYIVPRRTGTVLQRILDEPKPDTCMLAFQERVLSRLLMASIAPPADLAALTPANRMEIPEARLRQDFAGIGMPFSPGLRRTRARQLAEMSTRKLKPIRPLLLALRQQLCPQGFAITTEAAAREDIQKINARCMPGFAILPLLDAIRDMHETGGDLDTVASATLYYYGLTAQQPDGHALQYGHDIRFAFVNYHEGLQHLAAFAPAEVYMADLPIGALPDFEHQVRQLHAADVTIARYEDHHPLTLEHKTILERLENEGLIGYVSMSGPLQGSELPDEALLCGADMVYASTLRETPLNNQGAKKLTQTAHSEDFVSKQTTLGTWLTDLIKGGICKIEMVQALFEGIQENNFTSPLSKRGWDSLQAAWDKEAREVQPRLLENAFLLELPQSTTPPFTSPSASRSHNGQAAPEPLRILMALALRNAPGAPRLPVGKAMMYYMRAIPELDYVFYCYGASMLVARRANQADVTLNLGDIMPLLGTQNDGGHAGAAVCRPDQNSGYPSRLLGRVSAANFPAFTRYIAARLGALGYRVSRIRNISTAAATGMRTGGRKLLWITLLAIAIGLTVALLFPRYRPDAILESNRLFFPNISTDDDAHDYTGETP